MYESDRIKDREDKFQKIDITSFYLRTCKIFSDMVDFSKSIFTRTI
jgi:hypothetical protein